MKFTIRILIFALVLVSSAVQAANHSIHGRQTSRLENGECQAFRLYTRGFERSFVRVLDRNLAIELEPRLKDPLARGLQIFAGGVNLRTMFAANSNPEGEEIY